MHVQEEDIVWTHQGVPEFEVAKWQSFTSVIWEWAPGQAVSAGVLSPVTFELVGSVFNS